MFVDFSLVIFILNWIQISCANESHVLGQNCFSAARQCMLAGDILQDLSGKTILDPCMLYKTPIYYMAEMTRAEKELSGWFPEQSEFSYTDR